MSLVDLSALGQLNAIEQLDGASYADNQEKSFRLAPKGVYTLRAPESFPQAAFGKTKNGDLSIQIDPTITGPTNEGYVIKYQKISAKTFDRGGKPASQLGDYLRACGWRGTLTGSTPAEVTQNAADAVAATAGLTYQAKLDWRAYNKRTGFALQGMERFPKLEDGTYQSYVIDPSEVDQEASKAQGKLVGKKDENGKELRVWANLEIPFGGFIPSTN